jgi:hypothetical protein
MSELLLLAIASAFWPILLVVVIISLRASRPILLLVSFLAGGLLTTMAIGLAVIYALEGSSLTGGSQSTFDPAVLIVAGTLALLAAAVLWRRYGVLPEPKVEKPSDAGESGRLERMLDRGAPLAFAAGIVCNIIPGVFPLIALKDIAEMNLGFAETFAVLLGFYLIMFALIEVPLVSYLVAPEWTQQATLRFNTWLDRNTRRVGIGALAVVGAYLVVKGIYEALT